MSTGFPHGNIILTKFVNIYTKRWSANGILCQQAQGYVRGHMLFEELRRIVPVYV